VVDGPADLAFRSRPRLHPNGRLGRRQHVQPINDSHAAVNRYRLNVGVVRTCGVPMLGQERCTFATGSEAKCRLRGLDF